MDCYYCGGGCAPGKCLTEEERDRRAENLRQEKINQREIEIKPNPGHCNGCIYLRKQAWDGTISWKCGHESGRNQSLFSHPNLAYIGSGCSSYTEVK